MPSNCNSDSAAKMSEQYVASFPEGLSQPALRALRDAGYTELDQLGKVTESQVLQLHGMGPKGIRILKQALLEKGLSFSSKK